MIPAVDSEGTLHSLLHPISKEVKSLEADDDGPDRIDALLYLRLVLVKRRLW